MSDGIRYQLPESAKSRKSNPVEPEILPPEKGDRNALDSMLKNNAPEIIQVVRENMPALIEMAGEVVEITKIRAVTEQQCALLESQRKLLEEQSRAFIHATREAMDRENKKAQNIIEVLRLLKQVIMESTKNEEVEVLLIKSFDKAIEKL